MESNKRYIIIDTDPGIDDAQAIMMALANRKHLEIVAFTTVTGNCNVDQGVKNLKRLLDSCQVKDIPIYKGSKLPIMLDVPDSVFHGEDGFGDFYPDDYNSEATSDLPAAQALIQYGKKFQGNLELVCLGPLTNLALGYHLDTKFSTYFKHIYIMGGNYLGRGNVTPTAEYNFYTDPEAAHVVIRAMEVPKTLVCWELCENNQVTWDWYHNVWGSIPTETNEFRKNINQSILKKEYKKESSGYYLCDELLMGVVLWPQQLVTASVDHQVRVILNGECRGMLACDSRFFTCGELQPGYKTVRIVTALDMQFFKDKLIDCIKELP